MVCSRCSTSVMRIKQAQILCILPLPLWVCHLHSQARLMATRWLPKLQASHPHFPKPMGEKKLLLPRIPSMWFH